MSKRIVICIDGTNNRPGAGRTNVQRLFRMLKEDAEQVVYYQPGAGTIEPNSLTTSFGRKALMLVDSVSAVMLQRHVCSAYRYLMSEYTEGDSLYLFGFSRGAYAARVLAGMLSKIGLLRRGLDEMVRFAWDAHSLIGNKEQALEFRNAYGRYIPKIQFLGLFDTVSAVGSPWKPRRFERTFSNHSVRTVRHALALDEHRVMFVPNLWKQVAEPDADPEEQRNEPRAATDVRQVWFAGVHADIGGGYAEDEADLSLIPLAWMTREAMASGLTFRPRITHAMLDPKNTGLGIQAENVGARCAPAKAHDELAAYAYWRAMESMPIPRWKPDQRGDWIRSWERHRARSRYVAPNSLVHASIERLRIGADAYQPRPILESPIFVSQ